MSDAMESAYIGEDFLEHYGVKGMHWGIRKDVSGPDISGLSNDELKKVVERMRLERQYSELAQNPRTSAGVKFIAKHADRIVGTVLGAVTSTVVGIAINRTFNK
jgi:hypothetical protein